MSNYLTLVDILRDRASSQPEQLAYTFLADGETESGSLTYRELDLWARAIAARLQSLVTPGTRALAIYPYHAGLEFIAAFMGCLYAGVVAVTDYPPQPSKSLSQFQERIISSQATIVLTTQALLEGIQSQLATNPELAPKLKDLPWIATDRVSLADASDWQQPQFHRDTLAFLQYTSGSTGTPKGVMVTHGNVLNNSEVIYQSFQHCSDTRVLMWLPMFHDMGLIGGVMQPLYGGFPVVLMSPLSLVQKPFNWLQAISRYRITTSGGPNFAYDLLCQKATPERLANLDLSSWDVAFSGAEPVRAETIERFSQIFEPCGFRREAFYPCYGMAETTLFVSGGNKTDSPVIMYVDGNALEQDRVVSVVKEQGRARAVVGCGRTWLGDGIVIVDPESLTRCSSDRVGEIWIAGPSVGKGYWQQPEETEGTFNAYLADTDEGPFLRTGDLGFVWDGELFITGRIKDLMIFWGRNCYPQHIEHTVQNSHPALRPNCCAAFSVEVGGEEKLVIAHEVERSYLRSLNVDEVVAAIRREVAQQHVADLYAIVLLKTASIPKTTSGKIQRRACRQLFREDSLEVVGKWQQQDGQQSNITELMSQFNS
jgi:acyl-CoA synthetase (AMP-forming)/AMP-acid ligase II